MPEPADRPPSLRERLADALHCPTCGVEPGAHCLRARVDNRQPHMTRVREADAVLPVVEAETAALRQRIEEVEEQRDQALAWQDTAERERDQARSHAAYLDEEIITPERALHEQTIQRAEQAERERDEALEALAYGAETLRRAEQVERERTEALAAVRRAHAIAEELADGCPWSGNEPAIAKRLLTALTIKQPKETP